MRPHNKADFHTIKTDFQHAKRSSGSRKRTHDAIVSIDDSDDEIEVEEVVIKKKYPENQSESKGPFSYICRWLKGSALLRIFHSFQLSDPDPESETYTNPMPRKEKFSHEMSWKAVRREAKERGTVNYSPVRQNPPDSFVTISRASHKPAGASSSSQFTLKVETSQYTSKVMPKARSQMVHGAVGGQLQRQHIHPQKPQSNGGIDEDEIQEVTPFKNKNTFGNRDEELEVVYESEIPFQPLLTHPVSGSADIQYMRDPKRIFKNYRHGSLRNSSDLNASYRSLSRTFSSNKTFTQTELINLEDRDQYKQLLKQFRYADRYKPLTRETPRVEYRDKAVETIIERNKENLDFPVENHAFTKEEIGRIKQEAMKPCRLVTQSEYLKNLKETEKKPEVITVDEEIEEELKKVDTKTPIRTLPNGKYYSPEYFSNLMKLLEEETRDRLKIEEEQEKKIAEIREKRALLEKAKGSLKLSKPVLQDKLEVILPEITPEMNAVIEGAFAESDSEKVLSKLNNLQVLRKDIETLVGLNWLNDEIINFYIALIIERSKQPGYPSTYAFNTFFFTSLNSKGYSAVKRWTRKVDIFSYDMILVPVHLGIHWCLAIIDFRIKKVQFYDSMLGKEACFSTLRDYLVNEAKDKKGQDFNLTPWTFEAVKDIPMQLNGSDCGMFTLKYAEYITRDAQISFTQDHMPYFRKRMVYEILKCTIL